MAWGIKDKYTVTLSLEDQEIPEISKLSIEEYIDLRLPTMVAGFSLNKESDLDLLTEGKSIILRIGSKHEEKVYKFSIASARIHPQKQLYDVEVAAISNPSFNTRSRARSIKGSSVDVLKSVLGEYFQIVRSDAQTDDKMVWIQTALDTDRSFALRVLQHSFVPGDDALFVAIGASGEAMITTFKKLSQEKPLRAGISEDADLVLQPDLVYKSAIASYVSSSAYLQMDLLSGKSDLEDPRPKPIYSPSQGERYVEHRIINPAFISPDLHPNYWVARSKNAEIRAQLRSLQAVATRDISDISDWIPLGTLIDLELPDMENPKSRSSKWSGRGIVTKVGTILLPGQGFRQILEISRDAHSL